MASATSKEMEIKLTNVARASLEELLEDYRDFIRTRNIEEWSPSHPSAQRLSFLLRSNASYSELEKTLEHTNPAISANAIIGIVKVTSYLLKKQIAFLEKDFLENGGLREKMTRARLRRRG